MSFIDQIQGANTSLKCVVRFFSGFNDTYIFNPYTAGSEYGTCILPDGVLEGFTESQCIAFAEAQVGELPPIQLSLSDIPNSEFINYPFLAKFPTIKESINIETKKYSISSVTLSIHNADIRKGQKFSDLLDTAHFRINKLVEVIYYANDSIDQQYLAYKGKIKYTSHNQKSVKIELEDATQDSLFIDVPVKNTPSDESFIEKSRNIPYPMTYGRVPKSPCIFSAYLGSSDNYTINPSIYFDSPESSLHLTTYLDSVAINSAGTQVRVVPIYIGIDGGYAQLARFAEKVDSGYEIGSAFDNFDIEEQGDFDESSQPFVQINKSGNQSDAFNKELRAYLLRKPLSIELISERPNYIPPTDVEEFNSAFSLIEAGGTPSAYYNEGIINYDNEWTSYGDYGELSPTVLASEVANGKEIHLTLPYESAINMLAPSYRSLQRISTTNNYPQLLRHEAYRIKVEYPPSSMEFPCTTYFIACIRVLPNPNSNLLHLDIPDSYYEDDFGEHDENNMPVNAVRVSGYINLSVSGDAPTMVSDNIGASWWSDGQYGGGYGDNIDGRFMESATPYTYLKDGEWNSALFYLINSDTHREFVHNIQNTIGDYLFGAGDQPNNPFKEDKATWSGKIGGNNTGEFVGNLNEFVYDTFRVDTDLDNNGTWSENCKSDTWATVNKYNNITVSLNDQIRKSMPDEDVGFGFFGWDSFKVAGLRIFQNIFIPNYWDQSFYADIKGRQSIYVPSGQPASVQNIINDIVGTELKLPESVNDFSNLELNSFSLYDYEYPRYAFTQTEKINSKSLIEELSVFTTIFPLFKGNQLTYKVLKGEYNPTSVDIKTINSSDVKNYSFKRTDIRELYSKITFNYNYDFSLDKYMTPIEFDVTDDLISGYDKSYYGAEILDKSINCRFIYDSATAIKVAKYLLLNNCNPHNIITVDMPLSYMNYELGDIVRFNSLINGQKIYGENYSHGFYNHNGQDKYGLFIIQSIKKGQKGVTLELYQLHKLTGGTTQIQYYCPLENYEEYEDLQMGFGENNIWYQPDESECITPYDVVYPEVPVYGCTSDGALNYDVDANTGNGSCFYLIDEHWIGGFTSAGDFLGAFNDLNVYNQENNGVNYGSMTHLWQAITTIEGGSTSPIMMLPSDPTINVTANIDTHRTHVTMGLLLPHCMPFNTYVPFENSWDQLVIYIKDINKNNISKKVFNYDDLRSKSIELTQSANVGFLPNNIQYATITSGENYWITFFIAQAPDGYNKWWGLTLGIPIIDGYDTAPNNLHYRAGHFIAGYTIPGYTIPGYTTDLPAQDISYTYNFAYDLENNILPNKNVGYSLPSILSQHIHVELLAPSVSNYSTVTNVFGRMFYGKESLGTVRFDKELIIPEFPPIMQLSETITDIPYILTSIEFKQIHNRNGILAHPFSDLTIDTSNHLLSFEDSQPIDAVGINSTLYNFLYNTTYESPQNRANTFYILIGSTNPDFQQRISTDPSHLNYAEIRLKESMSYSSSDSIVPFDEYDGMVVDERAIEHYGDNLSILRTKDDYREYLSENPWTTEIRVVRYSGATLTQDSLDGEDGSINPHDIQYVPFTISHREGEYEHSITQLFGVETIVKHIDFRDLSEYFNQSAYGKKIRVEFYNNSELLPLEWNPTDDYYYIEIKRKSPIRNSNSVRYLFERLPSPVLNAQPSDEIKKVTIFNGMYIYTYNYKHHRTLIHADYQHPLFTAIQGVIDNNGNEIFDYHSADQFPLAHKLFSSHTLRMWSHITAINNMLEEDTQAILNEPSDCKVGYTIPPLSVITPDEVIPDEVIPDEAIDITNSMGVYIVNNKTIDNPTGGADDMVYHNEFYAIGNPANEVIYDIDTVDEDDIELGEAYVEFANNNTDATIDNLIALGHSKEIKIKLIDDEGSEE